MSEPTNAPPRKEPPPPHLVAILAATDVARAQIACARAQIDAAEKAIDAILAAVQAGHYSAAQLAGIMRERTTKDRTPSGMPAVFGQSPFQPGVTNGNEQPSSGGGDPLERIDVGPDAPA
jgi:hypothetical protein